jgi:ElaB/YqjD/DUF883 family membrane-anchored ribosome-binding protein
MNVQTSTRNPATGIRTNTGTGGISETAREAASGIAGKAHDMAEGVAGTAKDWAAGVGRGAERAYAATRDTVVGAEQSMESCIRRNPWEAVFVAFGAGCLLGCAMGRR